MKRNNFSEWIQYRKFKPYYKTLIYLIETAMQPILQKCLIGSNGIENYILPIITGVLIAVITSMLIKQYENRKIEKINRKIDEKYYQLSFILFSKMFIGLTEGDERFKHGKIFTYISNLSSGERKFLGITNGIDSQEINYDSIGQFQFNKKPDFNTLNRFLLAELHQIGFTDKEIKLIRYESQYPT